MATKNLKKKETGRMGRPPKDVDEKLKMVSLKLHPKVIQNLKDLQTRWNTSQHGVIAKALKMAMEQETEGTPRAELAKRIEELQADLSAMKSVV